MEPQFQTQPLHDHQQVAGAGTGDFIIPPVMYPGCHNPADVGKPADVPNKLSGEDRSRSDMESGKSDSLPRDDLREFTFSEQSIRNAFIRKVYSILMVQLAISGAFISYFAYNKELGDAMRQTDMGRAVLIGALFTNLGLVIAMSCCESARRVAPTNYILLFTFTIIESVILGFISSLYDTESVVIAVGLCAVICLALTVFSFQTKIDFTTMGAALYVTLVILFVFGLTMYFVPSKTGIMIYASIGVLLFSLFLIYDTQRLIGGKHKYAISPEEYVFAALCLYIDIIQIFMMLLRLIGGRR